MPASRAPPAPCSWRPATANRRRARASGRTNRAGSPGGSWTSAAAGRARAAGARDRGRLGRLAQDRRPSHPEHLHQDQRVGPGPPQPCGRPGAERRQLSEAARRIRHVAPRVPLSYRAERTSAPAGSPRPAPGRHGSATVAIGGGDGERPHDGVPTEPAVAALVGRHLQRPGPAARPAAASPGRDGGSWPGTAPDVPCRAARPTGRRRARPVAAARSPARRRCRCSWAPMLGASGEGAPMPGSFGSTSAAAGGGATGAPPVAGALPRRRP